jgi:predicted amidohydrolase
VGDDQRSHAIANGCYVAAVNRVGHEAPCGGAGHSVWGQSFICGPNGEIIAKGSVDNEEIVMAEVAGAESTRIARMAISARSPHRCLRRAWNAG